MESPITRVLHICAGNLYGGVETFQVALARHAARPGPTASVEHCFAVCFEGRLSLELAESGSELYRIGDVRLSRPWTTLRARRRLGALLNQRTFDLVVSHSSWVHGIFGSLIRRRSIPVVYYLHGPITRPRVVDRLAARVPPDLMIGVSEHTVNTGRQLFSTAASAVVNYPLPWEAIPAKEAVRSEVRAELGAGNRTVILQASRMEAWKGHAQLLTALGLIRDDDRWVCWIAGGAQRASEVAYRERLEHKVRELGLESRVRFLGERRDVPRLLAAADVLCQANTGPEGFSLAFMEAFAAGLPIVTTRLGGAPELIDGTTGVLTPPGDIAALADALRKLVDDPALRARMGDSAVGRVRALCDPAQQFGRLDALLLGVARRTPT